MDSHTHFVKFLAALDTSINV